MSTSKLEQDPKTGRITKGVAQDTNKNGTAGRPTKYSPEYCEQMITFFSGDKKEKVLVKEQTSQGKYGDNTSREWKWFAKDTPFFEKFARSVGVHYATLYEWAHGKIKGPDGKDTDEYLHPEFHEAYNICKDLQKEFLIDNGLQGLYPPASFIFVAKNITDMKDINDIKIAKGKGEDDIDEDELKAAVFG